MVTVKSCEKVSCIISQAGQLTSVLKFMSVELDDPEISMAVLNELHDEYKAAPAMFLGYLSTKPGCEA